MIDARYYTAARYIWGTVVLVAFASTLLWVPNAYAQHGITVQVQPSTIEERVDPGDVLEGVLTITNKNGGVQTYYLDTRNITGMGLEGRPSFAEELEGDAMEAAAWIHPLKDSITLAVGESTKVPYRIEVPAEASPGSYFAAIFVTREADVAIETGAGVGFHVATLVNLRVNGNVVDSLQVREFSVDKHFYTEPHIMFTTHVENTGTVHQRPQGIISITDMLGNDTAKITVNEQAGGVMPRTEREFKNEWAPDTFVFGRYTVFASIVYGDTQRKTITRELSFWVVPLKETGMVVGGIVAMLLLAAFLLRAYVRRALRKAGHTTSNTTNTQEDLTFARRMVRTLIRLAVVLVILFIAALVFFA
jgi:hypothetical protein